MEIIFITFHVIKPGSFLFVFRTSPALDHTHKIDGGAGESVCKTRSRSLFTEILDQSPIPGNLLSFGNFFFPASDFHFIW
ncbi:hypothetical protein [Faecalibacterium sp. An122]|uniref:hypothetical protein n=1 Tax=Faecalibacterium sp. An122 TaxID=1965551 RepID=UPI000B3A6F05|nr:hypothetical protein [Faecalibacterium sp. An122]OUQ40083.1 hypothetical protein B5E67_01890 [Faecalibacterium sp. An122]